MSKPVKLCNRPLEKGETLLLVTDIEGVGDELELQPVLSIGWVVCARIKFDDPNEPVEEVFEKGRVTFKPDIFSLQDRLREEYLLFRAENEKSGRYISYGGWFFGRRCYEEFWLRQSPELLSTLVSESLPPEEAINGFLSIEQRWPIGEIMSDNPAYDLTRIDFAIKRYSGREYGMHYTWKGGYRNVADPSEIYHYLPMGIKSKLVPEKATHFPDDDALDIYRWALKIKKAVLEWESAH